MPFNSTIGTYIQGLETGLPTHFIDTFNSSTWSLIATLSVCWPPLATAASGPPAAQCVVVVAIGTNGSNLIGRTVIIYTHYIHSQTWTRRRHNIFWPWLDSVFVVG